MKTNLTQSNAITTNDIPWRFKLKSFVIIFLVLAFDLAAMPLLFYIGFIFSIKYSGLFYGGGDGNPLNLFMQYLSFTLVFCLPFLSWLLMLKLGILKNFRKQFKILLFFLFTLLPLWVFIIFQIYSVVNNYLAEKADGSRLCVIANGMNKTADTEVECQNGVYNGTMKLTYEGRVREIEYKNGFKTGKEVFYNADGSTTLYILPPHKQVYFQRPERAIEYFVNTNEQKYSCENDSKVQQLQICKNNLFDGIYLDFTIDNYPKYEVQFTNGTLDGTYKRYDFNTHKLVDYLEFKQGVLDGKVEQYSSNGVLEYQGNYRNGLQEGEFKIYDYNGELESRLIFKQGKVVEIMVP